MIKEIVLIDNNELFRLGLAALLGLDNEVKVKDNISLNELFKKKSESNRHDLVIIDPIALNYDFPTIFKQVIRAYGDLPIMVLTDKVDKRSVLTAIEHGVTAYFTKSIDYQELKALIYKLTHNEQSVSILLESHVKKVLRSRMVDTVEFTQAELEVLRLVCQQKSSVEISKELGISARTVESRKRNMMIKTKSKNMIGVIVYGIKTQTVDMLLD